MSTRPLVRRPSERSRSFLWCRKQVASVAIVVPLVGLVGGCLIGATYGAEPTATEVLEGHSYHGEAFNEGPRQFAYPMAGTGPISFEVSSLVPEVRTYVEQGIGQLHGFWYYEAERSFRHAATRDPECAIAYWGMALANKNNSERAKKFLTEAIRFKEKASPREILLIESLESLLLGEGDNKTKARRHVDALRQIVERYPDDLECKALLAYAYYDHRSDIGKSHEEVDAFLGEVLAKQPLHPVHHYRIHLWDDKDPARALESSAKCGTSSPAIAHMWHMPGHIYSRLKRYQEAVWQQEASARVDHAHMMRDRVLPDQIHNFAHNNEWLIRNLIFIGRHEDAVDLAINMIHLPRHPKYNTFNEQHSASYGRERLFDVLSQFELWDGLVEACENSLLEPTDEQREQVIRLRHLGSAYAELGLDDRCDRVIEELKSRLPAGADSAAVKEQEGAEETSDEAKGDDEDASKKKEREERAQRREQRRQAKLIDTALAVIRAHRAVRQQDFATALHQLKEIKEGRDELFFARVRSMAGEHDEAVKAIEEYCRTHTNEVLPLAAYVEILWRAGRSDEAHTKLQSLREISGAVQFGAPPFDRMTAIALESGLPSDWRIPFQEPNDFGPRPALAELGPFRWQPSSAPDWVLHDSEDRPIALADYAGRPVVLVFFLGNGCLHCAQQLGALAPIYERFQQAGISLVAISSDDAEGLRISLENYEAGFPFPLVSNDSLDLFRAYRAYDDFEQQPLHGTFLIDGTGRIRWQDISYEPFMDVEFLLRESQRLLKIDQYQRPREVGMAVASAPEIRHVVRKPIVDAAAHAALVPSLTDGLVGTVILAAPGHPEEAIEQFLAERQADQGPIVVVQLDSPDRDDDREAGRQIFARWNESEHGSLQFHRLQAAAGDEWNAAIESLGRASAVWLSCSGVGKDIFLAQDALVPKLQEILTRGGTVAVASELVDGLGERLVPGLLATIGPGDQCDEVSRADAGSFFGRPASLTQRLEFMPQWFGLQLQRGSAVIVRGRTLRAVGEGKVELQFAPTPFYRPRHVSLVDEDRTADLIALRRYAKMRLESSFPDTDLALPMVDRGALVIVGGGDAPPEIMRRFVELAGGADASVVVIPISMPGPLPERDESAENFRQLGVREVTVLTGRTPTEVDRPESLAALQRATGVWFGGGRQWRFVDAYDGTQAARLLHEVLTRGGVIGGSSAGASIQGDYLARGNPLGPDAIMADGYERGFAFLPGVAIDQHFSERRRQPDLMALVERYPRLLGIGIDESTAVIVQGSVAEVVGDHHAHFYDPASLTDKGIAGESIGDGGLYDLVKRAAINVSGCVAQ